MPEARLKRTRDAYPKQGLVDICVDCRNPLREHLWLFNRSNLQICENCYDSMLDYERSSSELV